MKEGFDIMFRHYGSLDSICAGCQDGYLKLGKKSACPECDVYKLVQERKNIVKE